MFFEHLTADHGAIDVTFGIDADALGAAVLDGGRFHVFDEGGDLTVPGATDADALLDERELVCARAEGESYASARERSATRRPRLRWP